MSSPGLQGLRPWLIQRITAVYLALYLVYLLLVALSAEPMNASNWALWVASPGNNISLGLFIIAMLWHAWIGMRDVILDYVANVVARMLVLTVMAAVILGSAIWAFRVLFLVISQ